MPGLGLGQWGSGGANPAMGGTGGGQFFCGVQAPGHMGSVVCGTRAL